MAAESPDSAAAPDHTASRHRQLLWVYTAGIFVSAALLFAVQPMFTKMVLPRLGGAPQVWSVAMVFFQAALLCGYIYAHLLTRYAPLRAAIIVHLALMIVASFALPLSIATGWGRPPEIGEAFWLLGLFTVSIGLPFFALSANGPLLQAWFARTDHPAAKDPYFLYAASNIGSFLALISYPVVIEPFVRLGDQTRLWSGGFYLLIALIAGCAALLWRSPIVSPSSATHDANETRPNWRSALAWTALAAVPSAYLVAVTAHISTDVAAVPLLWVIPLALYLATFVNVFSSRPLIPHWLVVAVQPIFIVGLIVLMVFETFNSIVLTVSVHIAVFAVSALMCHGELARRRPAPQHLTAFYMWMSFGGMIGGIATGLVAPHVFNWVMEYPILIVLAVLCRPGLALPGNTRDRILVYGGLAVAAVILFLYTNPDYRLSLNLFYLVIGLILAATIPLWRSPLPFAGLIAITLIASQIAFRDPTTISIRSFFGVHTMFETEDGRFRVLTHGTTIHGAQRIRDAAGNDLTGRPDLVMYYYDGSAMAQAFDAKRAQVNRPIRYAVIGLGAGSLACKAEAGDVVHYYEIDPIIIDIARNPKYFTFLSECRPDTPMIIGDARLTLADTAEGNYDLIFVDAFSSDAIPIHLLTREAMEIYVKKLAPQGIVILHVSNRHLELASVVAGIAAANGLVMRLNTGGDIEEDDENYKSIGTVAAVARKDEDFGQMAKSQFWVPTKPDPQQLVWTDDYSNIVGAVIRQQRAQ